MTSWIYFLYEITESINGAIPSYRLHKVPEGYNEALLKKTELTMKENEEVLNKLNKTQIQSYCFCPTLLADTNLFVNRKAIEYPTIT